MAAIEVYAARLWDARTDNCNTYDWLADVPGNAESTDLVEVQFKNTRKGYYHNVNNLDLKKEMSWRWRRVRAMTLAW